MPYPQGEVQGQPASKRPPAAGPAPYPLWLGLPLASVALRLLTPLLRMPNRLEHVLPARPDDSYLGRAVFRASGEFKEYCFAVVMLFYLLSVYLRMGKKRGKQSTSR